MDARKFALGGLLLLVSLSGCSALLGSLNFQSSPALVPNESAKDAGYTLEQYNNNEFNETVNLAGMEREVGISFHQAIYSETTSSAMTGAANETGDSTYGSNPEGMSTVTGTTVSIVSMPDAKVAGQSVNPLVRLPTEQIAKQFGENTEGNASDLEKQSEEQIEMLGQETMLSTFNGTAKSENGSKPASISMAKTTHEGDVVIVVAVSPQDSSENESSLTSFISNIEHPATIPEQKETPAE